jgi:membrane-associated phospholipid phosphatase
MPVIRIAVWCCTFLLGSFVCSAQLSENAVPDAPSAPQAKTSIDGSASELSSTSTLPNLVQTDVAGQTITDNPHFSESKMKSPFARVSWLDRFAGDQAAIWTSPFHMRRNDAIWALPSLAVTGAFVAGDSWLSKQVPASEISLSRHISNYGVATAAGGTAAMFLFGKLTHNDHAAETGFLAGEAAINATVVDLALQSIFQRQRPGQGASAGHFFSGGRSFPSEHAAVSWAIAGVVAHEYPGPLTKFFSYGLASAITVARVTGKDHFPSDAVLGGAMGYFVAQQIYRRRRDPEVSEGAWDSLIDRTPNQERVRDPKNMGSPYVPPDNWIYPLFERLAAMGYIESAYLGIRPWTRIQCARMLEEAHNHLGDDAGVLDSNSAADRAGAMNEAVKLVSELNAEFLEETRRLDGAANTGFTLDSVYARTENVAGQPLTDGYHFAQTEVNDYGRPYAQGFNSISGLTAHAEAGPFSFFLQGEYQHAAAVPSYSSGVQQAIAQADGTTPLANGTNALDRVRIINSSVAVTFHDLQFSAGKQSEWLGVGESGPFLASDNAPAINMFQIATVAPYRIPLVSSLLGPAQSTFFVGQLSGQNFDFNEPNLIGPGFHPQPFIHGDKVSFHPTANLEFGLGLTAIFGGPGLPFTLSEFVRSYYSHKASTLLNPAKRFSEFDISYRVPGLRKWLTVYNDSLVGDEISPIGSTRPMLNPGLYMPQVPKVPKLELRFEGAKDPFTNEFAPGFVYYDRRYRSGYTNDGNLIGSWIGRDGFGARAWATYWFSPTTKLQVGYRYQEADRSFLQGGRLTDYSLRAEARLKRNLAVSAFVQYENWMFPMLSSTPQTNVTASVQITVYPNAHPRH